MPTCNSGTLHGFAYDSTKEYLRIGECIVTTSDSDSPGLYRRVPEPVNTNAA